MDFQELLKDQRLQHAKAQLHQDVFVLSELDFKKNGYFVEFGATNGVQISNTWLLEKMFNWNGIVAEPSAYWHKELLTYRDCHIETDCVWSKTGETLVFNEVDTEKANYGPELSTIDAFSSLDIHADTRTSGKKYQVNTISLNDLLAKYNAPTTIDYLSIDTEGSEYEILSNFDFDKYDIKIITCEHNHTPMREKVFNLLTNKNYKRKFENLSKWDDWYIKD
jgi:FkbM family methyltransferase